MPDACLNKIWMKGGPNCRAYVKDYCEAEVKVAEGLMTPEMKVASEAADDEYCGPCANAIESEGECKNAEKGRFWKIKPMPDACLNKIWMKGGPNCRAYVKDYCEESAVGYKGWNGLFNRSEMKVASDADDDFCQPCATAIESKDKGCKWAAKGKFFKIKPMPQDCYGKVWPKGQNCRNYVQDYCSAEVKVAKGITFDLTTFPEHGLNVAMYALAAIGFGSSVHLFFSLYRKRSTYQQVIESEEI